MTLALAKRGAKTVGLDASEPYLDGARRLRSHPDIEYELGDACDLRYASASFDACVSTLVIDVIPEPDPVATEMRRVTRPGGVIACGTFDFWGGNSALDLVLDTGAQLDKGIRALRAQIKPARLCGRMDRQSSGVRLGSSTLWKCRSCSPLTTPVSRTTGPVGDRSNKDCATPDRLVIRSAQRNRASCSSRLPGRPTGRAPIVCRHVRAVRGTAL